MGLYHVVSVSTATQLMSQADLVHLLEGSRVRNEARGITGVLLYKDGNFLHVIEGEQAPVDALSAKIAKDPRHHSIIVLLRGPITERDFPDYSLGFHDLTSPEVHRLAGYNEFLNIPLNGKAFEGKPSRVKKLMQVFKQNMR